MSDFETEKLNVGDGWQPLITELHQRLFDLDPTYQVSQIKEKFGGLRYYVQFSEAMSDDEQSVNIAYALIREAEDESYKICEDCGTRENVSVAGVHGPGGWVRTLCGKCRSDLLIAREEVWANAAQGEVLTVDE